MNGTNPIIGITTMTFGPGCYQSNTPMTKEEKKAEAAYLATLQTKKFQKSQKIKIGDYAL